MDTHSFLINLLVFLGAAVTAVPLFHRFGLGSILGYLAAGVALGPSGLRVVTDVKSVLSFSEFGVVLLLFVIGLELKPSRLWVMRKSVFGLGTAQMGITTLVLWGLGMLVGLERLPAAVAAFGLSLSSTAFALQMLAERNQVTTVHGRSAFSILLFQDLIVIPALAIIPLLGTSAAGKVTVETASLLKGFGVMAAIVIGGRYLTRPLFRALAAVEAKEVFTAATLLLVLGVAVLMEAVGLSMALGTFLAGVLLSESEYRHELEADIAPFKGLLLGLFFMAVGMSLDFALALKQPFLLLGLTLGFMCVKFAINYFVGKATRMNHDSAWNLACVLPQGGEFAFVLFGVAVANGVLTSEWSDRLAICVTLSMALTPLVVKVNEQLFCGRRTDTPATFDAITDDSPPVIVAGYGRFGQIVARLMRVQGIPVTALEHDPEQVQLVRRFGGEIYYGDASRLDLLEAAGAKKAKFFVLAIDDPEASVRTAQAVKEHFPGLTLFARARNRQHAFDLMELGVTHVFRETFASSLEMAEDLLRTMGTPAAEARQIAATFRSHDEKTLQEQFAVRKDEAQMISVSRQATQQLADTFRRDRPQGPGGGAPPPDRG